MEDFINYETPGFATELRRTQHEKTLKGDSGKKNEPLMAQIK